VRAIIKVRTTVEREKLESLLEEIDWWPSLAQDHEVVKARKKEIIDTIAKEDLSLAESTYVCTIYDDNSKSWGIVSRPSEHGLAFRIKNPVSDRLKTAAEKLVGDLQAVSGRREGRKGSESTVSFDFRSHIEVLEPGSENHAYYGEVLTANRFALAVQQRRVEAIVGIGAAVVSLILLLLTFPSVASALFGSLSKADNVWLIDSLGRLATSAIVTATVSLLEVFLHWTDLRRKTVVQWSI
jgi:hypothetical protein